MPTASSTAALNRMRQQRRRDTAPEMLLRRELHRRGLRYFVDRAPLPGLRRRADIVFPGVKVSLCIDGCFWHSCPTHATKPKANAAWWEAKLEANRRRDMDTDERLRSAGWLPLRAWEHEDPIAVADRVEAVVRNRKRRGLSTPSGHQVVRGAEGGSHLLKQ